MRSLLIGLSICWLELFAQPSSQNFAVNTPPASNITGVSYSNYTSPGQGNTFYYWVLTTYPGGSVLDPTPQQINNVNGNDPSVGNPIQVSWAPTQGATSYSILKNTTGVSPVFPCTCLVATVSSPISFVNDTGAALSVIIPTFANTAKGSIRLNNSLYNPPSFESEVNGIVTQLGGSASLSPFVDVQTLGAKCDWNGTTGTDDHSAIQAALDLGGTVLIPGRACYVSGTLNITRPTILTGLQYTQDANGPGSMLVFPATTTGINVGTICTGPGYIGHNQSGTIIQNLFLLSKSTTSGTDDGIREQCGISSMVQNVTVAYFGRYGVNIDSTLIVSGNNDYSEYHRVAVIGNRSHGFYINGSDSQAIVLDHTRAQSNAGYGYFIAQGAHHTFRNVIDEFNALGMAYDYGSTDLWEWPYSEGSHTITFPPGAQANIVIAGNYGQPVVIDQNATTATNNIFINDIWHTDLVTTGLFSAYGGTVFNQTAVTGATGLFARAGEGQSGTPIFTLQNYGQLSAENVFWSGTALYHQIGGTGGYGILRIANTTPATVGTMGVGNQVLTGAAVTDLAISTPTGNNIWLGIGTNKKWGIDLNGNLDAVAGKGQHIQTQATNNDISGTCTFSGTTCTVTFTTAYTVAPACVANDQTSAAPIRANPGTGSLVLTGGTGAGATDVVAYHCVGNPN
jgi:hypothetical protein